MEANFTLMHANVCPFLPCDQNQFVSRLGHDGAGSPLPPAQAGREPMALQPYF